MLQGGIMQGLYMNPACARSFVQFFSNISSIFFLNCSYLYFWNYFHFVFVFIVAVVFLFLVFLILKAIFIFRVVFMLKVIFNFRVVLNFITQSLEQFVDSPYSIRTVRMKIKHGCFSRPFNDNPYILVNTIRLIKD